MTKTPLISVIITNYNYARYVSQAIESVLNQTYDNVEILIINDGSTDNSDEIIKKYKKRYPEIIYINQSNQGVVSSRNLGMEKATGDYLCCLDADDFFDLDYLEKQYENITQSNADVVYSNWQFIGDLDYKTDFPEFDFIEYQKQHIHIKPESLIRSSTIKDINGGLRLGYLPETKERANDWAYFITLAANGLNFKLTKDTYVNYRIKSGSMGNRLGKYDEARLFYKYLSMFKTRYGEKIIDPSELLIDMLMLQDERIKHLEGVVHDKDVHIKNLTDQIDSLKLQIEQIIDEQNQKKNRLKNIVKHPISSSERLFGGTDYKNPNAK